jgi:hypothetical protein
MEREVHIRSYFSLPTDLAKEFQTWNEFLSGRDYSVELQDAASGETVSVRIVEAAQDEGPYVAVSGRGAGRLFDAVLGMLSMRSLTTLMT